MSKVKTDSQPRYVPKILVSRSQDVLTKRFFQKKKSVEYLHSNKCKATTPGSIIAGVYFLGQMAK